MLSRRPNPLGYLPPSSHFEAQPLIRTARDAPYQVPAFSSANHRLRQCCQTPHEDRMREEVMFYEELYGEQLGMDIRWA